MNINSGKSVSIGNIAYQMMQPAMQQLRVRSAYPVSDVNHPYGTNAGIGVYRLQFGSSKYTQCIPYHATAAELQDALNRKQLFQDANTAIDATV